MPEVPAVESGEVAYDDAGNVNIGAPPARAEQTPAPASVAPVKE